MIPPWAYLEPNDRETFRATIAFLDKRLAEQGTIDWALKLKSEDRIERIAIEDILNRLGASDLTEPWVTAWRLIEESWASGTTNREDGTTIYGIQKRLRTGDRSGALISTIVDLVTPKLKVEPIDAWRWNYVKKPRVPKTVEHVLSASLTSGELIDLNLLELGNLTDVQFLTSLARELEAAVHYGLNLAGRLGWDGPGRLWQLGDLARTYYVSPTPRNPEDEDPDAFHYGIAPSTKLLHSVVSRIADIRPHSAQPFVRRWSTEISPVHVRLWAAMARISTLVSADDIASFLKSTDDRQFWDLHVFPEIAELRAVRFSEFDLQSQQLIVARIKKGPPRNHWPRKADKAKVANARLYSAIRELKRIETAGGVLPYQAKTWLDARLVQFADLAAMTIDEGFPESPSVESVAANPDNRFDSLAGAARLRALETALAAYRGGWDDDPAERANDWINQQDRTSAVLVDFEGAGDGGNDFPKVWNHFGWAHRPTVRSGDSAPNAELLTEASRVLSLLNQLSETTLSAAIEGICAWLDAWEKHVVRLPMLLAVWLRIWPLAVEATNRRPEETEEADLSVTARTDDDREPMDLDTLNTPAGKLVGVFLAACPSLSPGSQTFALGSVERQMRDLVIEADGRSGLIAKHRMIEALPYFLRADREWAQEHLITPLLNDDGAALALWRAVARRTHFSEVLKIIGIPMAQRATDLRLGRETRRRLVFSLVIESLHAFRENRAPAVPNPRIQQMLRMLDDEVRAYAANAVEQFVRELSAKGTPKESRDGAQAGDPQSGAVLFHSAASPFLREVWPQERSLATPGVSGALADLPAAAGDAFVEAVDTISRFLVPFECWSMNNYGIYGNVGDTKKLALIIDDQAKAQALLKLLDLTVGTSEGAVIPLDLTDALDQIRSVMPSLADSPVFRRLSTAARR
jgi:hypothetical protein